MLKFQVFYFLTFRHEMFYYLIYSKAGVSSFMFHILVGNIIYFGAGPLAPESYVPDCLK
jgi:hypothetical protein